MRVMVSSSAIPMAHPPRSNPFLRSSSDAPPFHSIDRELRHGGQFHGFVLPRVAVCLVMTTPRGGSHRSHLESGAEADLQLLLLQARRLVGGRAAGEQVTRGDR